MYTHRQYGIKQTGVPRGIRTPDLRFRKPPLYPAGLLGQISYKLYHLNTLIAIKQ